jgi:hypothetical protein
MYGIEAIGGAGLRMDPPGDMSCSALALRSGRLSLGDCCCAGCGGGMPQMAMRGSKCSTYSGGMSIAARVNDHLSSSAQG